MSQPSQVGRSGRALRWMGQGVLAWAATALVAMPYAGEPMSYPDGFRTWVHVKSVLITAAHPSFQAEGGLHHIYANAKAADGYRSGYFADGSVIVYELLETQEKN